MSEPRDDEAPGGPVQRTVRSVLRFFERGVVVALLVLMGLVIAVSAVELGWIIVVDLLEPPAGHLGIEDLLEIFGFFLLILIGLELFETTRAYLRDNVIHVQIVVEVAIIALARKAIVLDLDKTGGIDLLGIAALLLALAVAYWVERRTREPPRPPRKRARGRRWQGAAMVRSSQSASNVMDRGASTR